MAIRYSVEILPEAELQLFDIHDYIFERSGSRSSQEFIARIEEVIIKMEQGTFIGKEYPSISVPKVRRWIVYGYTSVFYSVDGEYLSIRAIVDNRSHPSGWFKK